MSKNTMIEMVTELEKITPKTLLITHMIEEAKAGEYHDYKNKKYDCGKIASVNLLQEALATAPTPEFYDACKKIRDDLINGEYDETADEEDKENLRKDIMANTRTPQEAQALMKVMGL